MELGPSINAVAAFSWDDMDMEMGHGLTCAFVTCIQKVHSLIPTNINTVIGDLFYRRHQVSKGLCIAIENGFHMFLGYCNHVTIHILGNIHEDQCIRILIHFETGDISSYYFAEYTIHFYLPLYLIVHQIPICRTVYHITL